jgi:hypothetical protein
MRSIYADWERGDFTNTDWADPDIEFFAWEIGTGRGVPRMAELWTEFLGTWDRYSAEISRIRELDDERVLVFVVQHGRGRASGLEAGDTTEGAALFDIRDGVVTRLAVWGEKSKALVDLGLEG